MTKMPLPPLSFHGLWSVCLQEEARVGTVGPTLSELAVVGLELAKRREREWSISRDWEWGQGGSGKAGGSGETEEEVWFERTEWSAVPKSAGAWVLQAWTRSR